MICEISLTIGIMGSNGRIYMGTPIEYGICGNPAVGAWRWMLSKFPISYLHFLLLSTGFRGCYFWLVKIRKVAIVKLVVTNLK